MHAIHKIQTDALASGETLRVNKAVAAFVDGVSQAHPDWTFVSHNQRALRAYAEDGGYDMERWITKVDVYQDGEHIGRVASSSYNVHSDQLELSNSRIVESRTRGSSILTTRVDYAVKQAKKYFYKRTEKEEQKELMSETYGLLIPKLLDAQRRASGVWDKFLLEVEPELYELAPQLIEALERRGKPTDEFEGMVTKQREYRMLHHAKHNPRMPNAEMWLAMSDGSWYAGDKINMRRVTADNIPREVRGALGLLKTQDPGTHIEGVGFRISNDKFLIVIGDSHE